MTVVHANRFSAADNWLRTHRRSTVAWIALYLGAASLVVSGIDHIQQYYANDYRTVPNIGRLFVLNFVTAVSEDLSQVPFSGILRFIAHDVLPRLKSDAKRESVVRVVSRR